MTTFSPAATAGRLVTSPALIAAGLSLYAGAIHLWEAPVHLEAWWGYGAFFIATGVAQVAAALPLVRRPRRWLVLGLVAMNLAIVATYVASRTSGIPIGPEHGGHRLEAPGALDLGATLAEVATVVALAMAAPRVVGRMVVNAALALGLALIGLRLTGVLA